MILDVIERIINQYVGLNIEGLFSLIFFWDFHQASENYALEKYSPQSKCFDHGSFWEQYIDQCRRKRRIIPQAAGCYQVSLFFLPSGVSPISSSMNVFHPKEFTFTLEKRNIFVNIPVKISVFQPWNTIASMLERFFVQIVN